MQVVWTQPFSWGLLLAYDAVGPFETPGLDRSGRIVATDTCLAVPVLHSADVEIPEDARPDDVLSPAQVTLTVLVEEPFSEPAEFAGRLRCRSGRLVLGDADSHRVVQVAPGDLHVLVARDAGQHSRTVGIALRTASAQRPLLRGARRSYYALSRSANDK